MKKSRFTETQIIKVLKEVEGGRLVKEVCREYDISDATCASSSRFDRSSDRRAKNSQSSRMPRMMSPP
jgi:hypothetical protein